MPKLLKPNKPDLFAKDFILKIEDRMSNKKEKELINSLHKVFYTGGNPHNLRRIPKHNEVVRVLNKVSKKLDLSWYFTKFNIYHIFTLEFLEAFSQIIITTVKNPKIPVLEICAGSGLITKYLQNKGINILAIDNNSWDFKKAAHVVNMDAVEAVKYYKPKIVIGCWLPYTCDADIKTIKVNSVDHYFHIGETDGGCTGSEALWHKNNWNELEYKAINNINKLCLSRFNWRCMSGYSDVFHLARIKKNG